MWSTKPDNYRAHKSINKKKLYIPAYSTRFLRKNDEVSAFRPFNRFTLVLESLLSVASLPAVDRLRFWFMRIDGFGVVVNRLALIIEIEDELNGNTLSPFRLDRDALAASVPDDNEYRLFVASLRTALVASASRVECRRENSSKLLSCLLLSIKMIRNKIFRNVVVRCFVQWNRFEPIRIVFFVLLLFILFEFVSFPCANLIP